MSSTTLLLSTSSAGRSGLWCAGLIALPTMKWISSASIKRSAILLGPSTLYRNRCLDGNPFLIMSSVSQREYAFGNKVDSLDMPGRGVEDLREPRLALDLLPQLAADHQARSAAACRLLTGPPQNSLTTRASSDFLTGGPTSTVRDLGALILTAQTVASSPRLAGVEACGWFPRGLARTGEPLLREERSGKGTRQRAPTPSEIPDAADSGVQDTVTDEDYPVAVSYLKPALLQPYRRTHGPPLQRYGSEPLPKNTLGLSNSAR